MGLLYSHRISRVLWYSGYSQPIQTFNYKTITSYGPAFQLCSSSSHCALSSPLPRNILLYYGLGSFPFARHYLGNRYFTFFSSGYLDVSVPPVPLHILFYSYMHTCSLKQVSFLIRTSADQCSFAAPRSLSQLVTSFFGA